MKKRAFILDRYSKLTTVAATLKTNALPIALAPQIHFGWNSTLQIRKLWMHESTKS